MVGQDYGCGVASGAQTATFHGTGIAGGNMFDHGSELFGGKFAVAKRDEYFNIRMNGRLRSEIRSAELQ